MIVGFGKKKILILFKANAYKLHTQSHLSFSSHKTSIHTRRCGATCLTKAPQLRPIGRTLYNFRAYFYIKMTGSHVRVWAVCCVKWSVPSHIETKSLKAVRPLACKSFIYIYINTYLPFGWILQRLCFASFDLFWCVSVEIDDVIMSPCSMRTQITYFITTKTLNSHFLCQQNCIFPPPLLNDERDTILMLCHSILHTR